MRAIEFRLSIRADEQHPLIAQLTEQMTQKPERATIRPVQVVCVQQKRLSSGDVGKHVRDGVEKEQTLFMRRQLRTVWKWTQACFDLGSQFGNLRCHVSEYLAQLIVVLFFAHPATKCFDKRQVRRRCFVFVAPACQDERAIDGCLNRAPPRGRCLAAPGSPLNSHACPRPSRARCHRSRTSASSVVRPTRRPRESASRIATADAASLGVTSCSAFRLPSNAARVSAAVLNRFTGSFANRRMITDSSARGRSGRKTRGGTTGA